MNLLISQQSYFSLVLWILEIILSMGGPELKKLSYLVYLVIEILSFLGATEPEAPKVDFSSQESDIRRYLFEKDPSSLHKVCMSVYFFWSMYCNCSLGR
jgi:hypothetical protein